MGLLKLHLFRAVALSLLGILLLVVFRDSGDRRRPVDARYIFTLFDGVKDLYVYTSSDAKNWTRYAGPTYTPEKGELRDPSIIYHTDGKYYITYTTGWFGTDFAIASSEDLKTWNLHATIPTSTAEFTPANSWAPEWFQDPQTGKLHVVISLSKVEWGPFLPYVYTAEDQSLERFSGPAVLEGFTEDGLGYIDTFPLYANGKYHVFAKAEKRSSKFIEHAVADAFMGPYEFVQTGDFAGWGHAEGPAVTTLPDGTFRFFADGFEADIYITSDSEDLYHWTPYRNVSGDISGTLRHGTILRQW